MKSKLESFEIERPQYKNPTVGRIWSLVEFYQKSLKEAAEDLGLSYGYVRRLASENHIHRFKKDPGNKKLLPFNRCPECYNEAFHYDKETGEVTCTKCGLIIKQTFSPLQNVPMNTTAALISQLAFNKSLGSKPAGGKRGYYQILARAPVGTQDLGIRAQKIRCIDTHVDVPQTWKLLEIGSELLKKLDLYSGGEYSQASHILGEAYGALLRRVGVWHFMSKTKIRSYKRLANATLYTVLSDFPTLGESLFQQPEKRELLLNWKAEDLTLVFSILEIGKTKKGKK